MGREIDQRVVRRAWGKFVERGDVSDGLRTDIAASWKRCSDFRVSTDSNAAPLVSEIDIDRHRTTHSVLEKCARPVFDRASKFLNESISMIILTDATGTILDTMGDDRAIDAGREIHLELRGKWGEEDIGTNAIGTAVALARPVQINGAEHFCTKVQRWTCAAAPIRHPNDGEVLGVVDISGPAQFFSSQSLALAMVMSDYIQSLIAGSCKQDRERLLDYFQSRKSRWLNEEVLVIDRRGVIVHASDNAMTLASNFQPGALQGGTLPELKNLPIDQWQERIRKLMPGANSDIVLTNECELGALVVLHSPKRASVRSGDALGQPNGANKRPTAVRGAQTGETQAATAQGIDKIPPAKFVSTDAAVAKIVRDIELAAPRKMPILIRGETGTGKEELARHAHAASRRKGAFIALNCAAMPDTLIEAELFGYVEGAFTGARRGGSPGLVREADHGTLFLDEIGDMPIALQPVLLRFLDDWTARPIGGSNHVVDILLVSATNAKLDRSITEGRFRSDLLYRLNTLDVALPALAERTDFNAIVRHLLAGIDPRLTISDQSITRLTARRWPGNIRELRNMLARLSLSAVEHRIEFKDAIEAGDPNGSCNSESRLWEMQRARVLTAHEETQGNISETARRLGISRNTVYRALGHKPKV